MTLSKTSYRRLKPALGTFVEITIDLPENHCCQMVSEAYQLIERLESRLSLYRPGSEICKINRTNPNQWIRISPELRHILALGIDIQSTCPNSFRLMPSCSHIAIGNKESIILSDNHLLRNCSCPLDLGGIAKGYCVDRAFDFLAVSFPHHKLIVNAGGDLKVAGTHDIHLRIPSDSRIEFYKITLTDSAIATSSIHPDKIKGPHLAAKYPNTSKPEKWQSATVVAKYCMLADAMTKIGLFHHQELSREILAKFNIMALIKFDEPNANCKTEMSHYETRPKIAAHSRYGIYSFNTMRQHLLGQSSIFSHSR